MTTSPRLGFTELNLSETIPEPVVNEIARFVEQGSNRFIVKDKDIDDPPVSPSDGDAYIVATGSPSGDWSAWAGRIAFYENTGWLSIAPVEGMVAYVQDENGEYTYDGSIWVPSSGGLGSPVTTQSGTSYTAVLGDANTYIQFTNGSPITFTIPLNSSVAFPVGTVIEIEQNGAGALTVAPVSGSVTINSRGADLVLAGQYAVAALKKVATDTWTLTGDL